MPSLKKINEYHQFLRSMDQFIRAYQYITVGRMQKNRDKVLANRSYMNGLLDIFTDVKNSFKGKIWQANDDTSVIELTSLKKNNRTALVLFTKDTRFSTHINRAVFSSFAQQVMRAQADVELVIVGKVGRYFFTTQFGERPHTYFDPEEDSDFLDKLISHIEVFGQVYLFIPRFQSLMKQTAVQLSITGDISQEFGAQKAVRENRNYFFEPDRNYVYRFFEEQLFAALVRQNHEESFLAHLGGQISTLESTQQTVKDSLLKVSLQRIKMSRTLQNKRQRERLSSMGLW